MSRTAHYVVSTHWDREWYEPLQGYRMRLVSLLDEVFETMEKDPAFKTYVMDGQVIPVADYLEIRPEKEELIRRYVKSGRFKVGPWYVLPDEWLISGESFIRNLQLGMKLSNELGAPTSRAGFVGDEFGHISQLPQIFQQLGIPVAFLWRGVNEAEHKGHFNWKSPDGTVIPTYRFGRNGYCSYGFDVRQVHKIDEPFRLEDGVQRLVDYVLMESKRSEVGPILVFDGADHMEIEPLTVEALRRANEKLAAHQIQIVHSDLDLYMAELLKSKDRIAKELTGELRETGKPPTHVEEVWAIPGILASRIDLKQSNAACEDELALWAEPLSAFAASALGQEYPDGYLRVAWKWLIENHPHDSMGGCSVEQVHQDMVYRFDQSLGIASRLTKNALKAIALAAAPKERPDGALVVSVFNASADEIDEMVDIDLPLPTNWQTWQEWERNEDKFAFRLKKQGGEEIPYQLVKQQRNQVNFRRIRCKFPQTDERHVVSVTAPLKVPAFGYTTFVVEPQPFGPTRHLGTLATGPGQIENDALRVRANSNGSISITDKKSGKSFDQLLTFEDQSDVGDGWAHGISVNDQVYTSAASPADVALVANGLGKATLRISVTMNLPAEFDFRTWARSERTKSVKIVSEVTLRKGGDRAEVTTTVDNTVMDHRLRVLFPTGLAGETYLSDSVFDIVERKIKLPDDNYTRRELDVEARPQMTWTAFGDGKRGLAIISRGLPESAVTDTPERVIALTLFRGFRRHIFAGEQLGGQVLGKRVARFDIVPYAGAAPVKKLCLLGQRINNPTRATVLTPFDIKHARTPLSTMPAEQSFLKVEGNAVVTSVQRVDGRLQVRLFNPTDAMSKATLSASTKGAAAKAVSFEGKDDSSVTLKAGASGTEVSLPGKRIATIIIG